jgi:uncharacterized protein (DUF488 family)
MGSWPTRSIGARPTARPGRGLETHSTPMTQRGPIYTIGHSNRTGDEFVAVLEYYRIQRLVDVRVRPRSRFPAFKGDALAVLLREHGIEYVWLGDLLGGFREGGYGAWMGTVEFRRGLERLEAMGEEKATAFMCAEREPTNCHRKYIAAALKERGWTVRHLIEPGEDRPVAEETGVQLGFKL